jgi:hypothetical protein
VGTAGYRAVARRIAPLERLAFLDLLPGDQMRLRRARIGASRRQPGLELLVRLAAEVATRVRQARADRATLTRTASAGVRPSPG